MKKSDSTFIVIHIKGGNKIRLNNESEISQELLSQYSNSVKAELYFVEDGQTKLIDTVYGN